MTSKKNIVKNKRKKTNRGRPRKEIDFQLFENMCAIQCTLEEIAMMFDVSEDTIERRVKEHYGKSFNEVFKKKRVTGLISLRRSQFNLAKKNHIMAIHLGKLYLGQKDTSETKKSNKIKLIDI